MLKAATICIVRLVSYVAQWPSHLQHVYASVSSFHSLIMTLFRQHGGATPFVHLICSAVIVLCLYAVLMFSDALACGGGVIIGIAVAVVVLLIVAIVTTLCACRMSRRAKRTRRSKVQVRLNVTQLTRIVTSFLSLQVPVVPSIMSQRALYMDTSLSGKGKPIPDDNYMTSDLPYDVQQLSYINPGKKGVDNPGFYLHEI